MIRFLTLILLILLPAVAGAETIQVSSGEHPEFSRLLLQYGAGPGWSLNRVEGGYEFHAERADIEYDLSVVFERIPRSRVSDVSDLGEGRLFIAMPCECHADAFVLGTGGIVLDIIDGPAPDAAARAEAAEVSPGASDEVVSPPLPDMAAESQPAADENPPVAVAENRPAAEDEAAPETPLAVSDRAGLPLMLLPLPGSSVPGYIGGRPVAEEARNPRVSQTQAALLEQIARAAAQGLLDADMSRIGAGEQQVAENSPLRLPTPVTPNGHVTVETSMDQAAADRRPGNGTTDDGLICLEPALFDVPSWGAPITGGAEFGAHRGQIVGEFDDPQKDGLTDLARYYVYMSFGAEAKAVIRRFPGQVESARHLAFMADIVDTGASPRAATYAEQMACDGPVALWAALAQPEIPAGQSVNAPAITLAFALLPVHLRRHLGPGLAEKFLAAGDRDTAEILRNATGRAAPEGDPAFGLMSARFDLADGNVEAANRELDTVMASDSDILPEALLERVNTTLGANQALPQETISLLESLAFEMQGSETGARLIDAQIRALAMASDFQQAYAILSDARQTGQIGDARRGELQTIIFAKMARNSSDPRFVRFIIGRLDGAMQLPAEERRAVAGRLLDLGFAVPARQVLGGGGVVPETSDRLLYARAALLEHRPEVAVGYLAGLSDETANRLRAEALAQAEDHSGAMRAFAELDDEKAELLSAWRGGLWSDVMRLDDGVARAAARLMTGEEADGGADLPATPLARSQALINRSQAAREALDKLLERFPELSFPSTS